MSKVWTIMLFAILMVVQTLSIASDVLPSHLGDIHYDQEHLHDSIGDPPAVTDDAPDRQGNSELPSLPDHCHGSHCHGSHLLLAMDVFGLRLSVPERVIPNYIAHHFSAHVDTILRPPIA